MDRFTTEFLWAVGISVLSAGLVTVSLAYSSDGNTVPGLGVTVAGVVLLAATVRSKFPK